MKINDLFRSKKSLSAADLAGKAVRVTIESVDVQKFDDGPKLVLHLVGKEKSFIANKTNALRLLEATGSDESDDWVGWSIVLYPTKVDFQGKRVDAIRIDDRPGATKPPAQPVRRAVAPLMAPSEPSDDGADYVDMPTDDDIDF